MPLYVTSTEKNGFPFHIFAIYLSLNLCEKSPHKKIKKSKESLGVSMSSFSIQFKFCAILGLMQTYLKSEWHICKCNKNTQRSNISVPESVSSHFIWQ